MILIFEDNIQVGSIVNKGDMLGCFLFGGSDFVMIFQQKAGFIMESKKGENSGTTYQHMLMCEKYGVMNGKK